MWAGLLFVSVALPGLLAVRVYLCAFLGLSGLPGPSGASWRGSGSLVPWFPGCACCLRRSVWRSSGFWSRGAIDDRSRGFRAFLRLLGAF